MLGEMSGRRVIFHSNIVESKFKITQITAFSWSTSKGE